MERGRGRNLERQTSNIKNMQLRIINILAMMKRTLRFILENPINPANARVTALTAEITSAIASVEDSAKDQSKGSGSATGGVYTRRDVKRALRNYAKDLCRIGRSLDSATYPGVSAKFVLPRQNGYERLIAAVSAMVAHATPLQAVFVEHGMPSTFIADLNALMAGIQSGTTDKSDGLLEQVGGTTGLSVGARKGLEAAAKLDAVIRAVFRNDPVALAKWRHARHVQKANAATPAEEMPGAGSGSPNAAGTLALEVAAPNRNGATALNGNHGGISHA